MPRGVALMPRDQSFGDGGEFLTKADAAAYLSVSQKSIQRYIALYNLPHYRRGRSVRFKLADLDEFMERGRQGGGWPLPSADTPLAELGRQAQIAGIRQIFRSRAGDGAYKAAVSVALSDVPAGGLVRIMSNSLRFLLLLSPQVEPTLFTPMCAALQRDVQFQLLLLDPDSNAARTRAGVEQDMIFGEDDDRFYDSPLYKDIVATARAVAHPDTADVPDRALRERLEDRDQLQVRFSSAEPTTHLVLTADTCFVENYHTGGDSVIQSHLAGMGFPDLHCFGGFVPVLSYDKTALAGRLMESHFEHTWSKAADGPTVEHVLARAAANGDTN
jgi:excisionase family DNA binding protein